MLKLTAAEYVVVRAVNAVMTKAFDVEPDVKLVEVEIVGKQSAIYTYNGYDGDVLMGLLRRYAVKVIISPAAIYIFTIRTIQVPYVTNRGYYWLPIDASWHQQHEPVASGLSAYESHHDSLGFDSTVAFCLECKKSIPAHRLGLNKHDQQCPDSECCGELIFRYEPNFIHV